MTAPEDHTLSACREISSNLLRVNELTLPGVRREIMTTCSKYSLARIPKNHEILATVSGGDRERLRRVLIKKPIKTGSGVAVIALMPKPYACPHGRCTYCPGGPAFNTPNSYTGKEPSTRNAIENAYDPKKQILTKLDKLLAYGHDASKIELVIVGGTFLFMPEEYREEFIKLCYDALNGFDSDTLEEAKVKNESAAHRNVGFTVETKPDYCKSEHVDRMLHYGITRVEIGVQSLRDRVYRITNRGHDYADVVESFRVSKDAGYKIVAHMMPGLPTMTPEDDMVDLIRLFEDPDLRPDMLKIYPSLVLKDTPLFDDYRDRKYVPYSENDMVRVLTEAKKHIPRWVRIMRVQREISPSEIVAGPKSGNLRQFVLDNMRNNGLSCRCIRCREAGLAGKHSTDDLRLDREDYDASGGKEVFLSYVDRDDSIYGFLRLRSPGPLFHRPEITPRSCVVRELHIYGESLGLGERRREGIQHSGLGKRLMREAEAISSEEFDANRILVISAVGTRGYYKKIGYSLDGPYMTKDLPCRGL